MSSNNIHTSAVIDPTAEIGKNVEIGPFAVVEAHAKVGDNSKISAHAIIHAYSQVGQNTIIAPGAVIGGLPQDRSYKGERTYTVVGDNVFIGEYATLNRATGEGEITSVGDGSFIMAYSHLGHNCKVGKEVTIANNAAIGGHVVIGDYAVLGGVCALHQHVRVGRFAMYGAFGASRVDLPPFAMVDGTRPPVLKGLNLVGLKRRGIGPEDRKAIKQAFTLLFANDHNQTQAIEIVKERFSGNTYVNELVEFLLTSSRGVASRPDRNLLEELGTTIEDREALSI